MRIFTITITLAVIFAGGFIFFAVPADHGQTMFQAIRGVENSDTSDRRNSASAPSDKQERSSSSTPQNTPAESDESGAPQNSSGEQTPPSNQETEGQIVLPKEETPGQTQITQPAGAEIPRAQPTTNLSQSGVLNWTNTYRQEAEKAPLERNAELDRAAKIKVYDMFDGQYFEHVAPDGTDIADVVGSVEYEFVTVGENLALGDFRSNKDLVDAWMASEGHRENILKGSYEEIGIALQRGNFKGNEVWLAVQAFAKPTSSCPSPDRALKAEIQRKKEALNSLSEEIEDVRNDLESGERNENPENYNEKVEHYNELADKINALNKKLKVITSQYNTQVDQFNACASGE